MCLPHSSSYAPLDAEGCRLLAEAIGDTPETTISIHLLMRGMCKAYVSGEPSLFSGAIVQANADPAEPVGFGSDHKVLWDLLQSVDGWECILVDSGVAPALGEIIEQEMGVRVRYLDDVCHTLPMPPLAFRHEEVRQLTQADLPLLSAAPVELRASFWGSPNSLVSEGVVACAIVNDRIVATALTAACSDHYADIGVYTHPDFRGRGYATSAASIVTRRAQESGRTPVWGAGEHNLASLRVARKLGFVEVSRRTYVIL